MFTATSEPDDDEQVTRAKYFIRDEFLVSANRLNCCGYMCLGKAKLYCLFGSVNNSLVFTAGTPRL